MAYLALKRKYKKLLRLLVELHSSNSSRNYSEWTAEEVAILRFCYGVIPTSVIAKMLGRSVSAIYAKAYRLGLKSNKLPKHLAKLLEQNESTCKI